MGIDLARPFTAPFHLSDRQSLKFLRLHHMQLYRVLSLKEMLLTPSVKGRISALYMWLRCLGMPSAVGY